MLKNVAKISAIQKPQMKKRRKKFSYRSAWKKRQNKARLKSYKEFDFFSENFTRKTNYGASKNPFSQSWRSYMPKFCLKLDLKMPFVYPMILFWWFRYHNKMQYWKKPLRVQTKIEKQNLGKNFSLFPKRNIFQYIWSTLKLSVSSMVVHCCQLKLESSA